MMPSAFVTLDALPLNSNGKVDRGALPAPVRTMVRREEPLAPARGELERAIAGIWCEILDLPEVGVHDNFFDLGGHSLLLIKVHVRLVKTLECDLTVMDLFRHPPCYPTSLRSPAGSDLRLKAQVVAVPDTGLGQCLIVEQVLTASFVVKLVAHNRAVRAVEREVHSLD